MPYGPLELAYATPIATTLELEPTFGEWLVGRTRLADHASGVRLLADEVWAKRSKAATTWWRSHFTEKCRCPGCSGQETDLLTVFEDQSGLRFAVHVEIKHPGDKFSTKRDQAGNYSLRAACWARNPPANVLKYDDADTMLLCSASRMADFAPHAAKFGSVTTFEYVGASFPSAVPTPESVSNARRKEIEKCVR